MSKPFTGLLLALVVGCATPRTHGNFLGGGQAAQQARMALDAADVLGVLYPAGSTPLELEPGDDVFSRTLIAELRKRGFAILSEGADARAAVKLLYIVDPLGRFLRLTLVVRSAHETLAIARAYAPTKEGVQPAGAWARMVR